MKTQRMLEIGAILVVMLFACTNISLAIDLSNYPAPFITGNRLSGYLVVGDRASAEDIVGVSDIAVSLQYATYGGRPGGQSGNTSAGSSWLVSTSANQLEMSQNTDTFSGETIGSIRTTIDETELTTLNDASITTEKGTARYNQYLNFLANNQSGYVRFMENDNDTTADFLYFRSASPIARYSIEFTTSLKTDVEDSAGTTTSTGTFLGDLEDESLSIMGRDFSIVRARRTAGTGANTNSAELTLMGGAVRDTLEEGESKTYTVQGKEYEVTVTAITDTGTIYARFNINGESVRSLADGDSATLSDGTEIGVVDVLSNEAGDVTKDLVEFFIGASKVFLKDTDVTDSASSHALEVGNDRIEEGAVIITGSNDNSTFNIDTIQLNVSADDDFYVAAGRFISEYMDEPDVLLGGWDIYYNGLSNTGTETYRLRSAGSDQYELTFTDGDGNSATIPVAYSGSASTITRFGDNDNSLILNGTMAIKRNDYLVVSDVSQDEGNRRTYALRYRGADKVAAGETSLVKFDNLGTGDRIEQSFTSSGGDTADATLKIGGSSFGVINATSAASNDFDVQVDLDADGTIAGDTDVIAINTNEGQKIAIVNATNHVSVAFSTPNTNDFDNLVPSTISFNITADANREVAFSEGTGSTINWVSPSEENNINYAYTSMGARYRWSNPSGDPDDLEVIYPRTQRFPLVYITTTGALVTNQTNIETGTAGNRIEVGTVRLASEVANPSAQNLILVGGPCANAITANLEGASEDCAAGYTQGQGIIQLLANGNNVALVVAGYSGADTRQASQVLSNYETSALQGTRISVNTDTGATTVEERGQVTPGGAGGTTGGTNRTNTTNRNTTGITDNNDTATASTIDDVI